MGYAKQVTLHTSHQEVSPRVASHVGSDTLIPVSFIKGIKISNVLFLVSDMQSSPTVHLVLQLSVLQKQRDASFLNFIQNESTN